MTRTPLCILSDSHDNEQVIKRAVQLIKVREPELVLHCGDIVSRNTLKLFKGLPIRFVFGNNEFDHDAMNQEAASLQFPDIQKELELTYRGKQIYVYHGTRSAVVEEMATSQLYDYVFHGHTHLVRNDLVGRTRVINPGALFRAERYTFAALNPDNQELEIVEVS